MKKTILTSLVALSLMASANAGWYAGGHLFTNSDGNIDMFDSTGYALSAGYAFESGLRLETDVYTRVIATDNDQQFNLSVPVQGTFGFNSIKAIYDIKVGGKLTPYVGFGVRNLQWTSDKEYDSVGMNGMFIGGVSFAVDSTWSIDLQYNHNFTYAYMFDKDDHDSDSDGWSTWKIGATYKF